MFLDFLAMLGTVIKGFLVGVSFFFMTLLIALIVAHPLITCLAVLVAVIVLRRGFT